MIPLDDHGRSAFRAAVEAKDFPGLRDLLAPDVRFSSPAVFSPYAGRDTVGALLAVVGTVLGPSLTYAWQVREGDREVLCFTAHVDGREVEGVDLLHYDAEGRVDELVVMMRPLSGLSAVSAAIGAALEAAGAGR